MAARLQIVIEADDKARATIVNLDQDLQRLNGSADSTGGVIDQLGNSWGTAAGLVVAGGTAIIAALGYAAARAAVFEVAMDGVAAVSGASSSQMAKLSELALQLGADTQFSALQAAQGLEELVKGGVSIPDILTGAAEAMLNLAAAGGVDLPTAATIAANAMNQFGLAGADMARVADLIAGAANASSLDVNDFAQSLQMGGAVAKLAGVNFDDFAVAVGLMGKAGIVGSDAGTALKTMFLNLQPTTKAQTTLMKELGIVTKDGANTFFDAEGRVKSLAQVSGILQTAMSGLTKQQQIAALEVMFGTDAIRAAAVMADAGAAGFTDMADAMSKVSAADVARTRMDNLAGSVEQLFGALDTLAITIGLAVTPLLKEFVDVGLIPVAQAGVDMAQTFIRDVTPTAIMFGAQLKAWMPTVNSVATTVRDVLLAGLTTLSGMLRDNAGPAIASVAAVIGLVLLPMMIALIGTAWAAALPFIPLIAALAAVGAIVFLVGKAYQENFMGIKDVTDAVIGAVVPFITEQFGKVVAWTQENWPLIQKTIATVLNWIQVGVAVATAIVTGIWTVWGDEITRVATFAWNFIKEAIGLVLDTIMSYIKVAMQVITGDWDGAQETMVESGRKAQTALGRIWKLIADAVVGAVGWMADEAKKKWDAWTGDMIGKVTEMVTPMKTETKKWLDAISGAIDAAITAGGNVLASITTMASTLVTKLVSGIGDGVNTIRDKVRDTVTGAIDAAILLVAAAKSIPDFATKIITDIGANIALGVGTIKDKLVTMVSSALAGITGPDSGLTGFGTMVGTLISGITSDIATRSGAIGTAIKDAVNSAISGFNNSTSALSFSLGTVNVPGVGNVTFPTIGPLNLPDMPYLANGGITTGPTVAMLGDNPSRREAIIPLERAGEMGFGGNTYNLTVQGPLRRDVEPGDMLRAMRKLDLLYGAA